MNELRSARFAVVEDVEGFPTGPRSDANDLGTWGSDGTSALRVKTKYLSLLRREKLSNADKPNNLVDNHIVTEVSVVVRKQSRRLSVRSCVAISCSMCCRCFRPMQPHV